MIRRLDDRLNLGRVIDGPGLMAEEPGQYGWNVNVAQTLQDKLWSTADRVQGAQSLRQTLRQLKLALGPHADMLHADRARIGIDRGRILVRHDGSADLAEGLDIGDPEFEDWLQHARSAVTRTDARAPAVAVGQALSRPFSANSEPARLTLGVRCGPSDMSMDWAAALVADMVSNAAREQFNTDREGLREQAEALTTRAMELEPDNAAVLASCANAWNFVQGRRVAAHELAQRAIAVNPSNPMAWWASSVTRMYGDNLGTGYLEAQRGQALARRSPHAFWWDSQIGFMALLHGESDEAIRRFERTALLMPEFRPALRYLIGLYASRRQFDAAQRAVERLRLVEPGFSVEQMVRDPGYPVSLLARAPELNLEPLAELC